MRRRVLIASAAAGAAFLFAWLAPGAGGRAAAMSVRQLPGAELEAVAVGHEYRQDDCPAIAAGPDGAVWAAWLSFDGSADAVAIRRHHEGKWGSLLWVPGASGDTWQPQVMADAGGRGWAVWSQQVDGNWDIYARPFDAARQEWGPLERLTSDPLPDINPRLWSDGRGRAALVWQGFRGRNSNILLRRFDGKWQPEVRVTSHAANDWEPAAVMDAAGTAWVVYDTYKEGNYDVWLAEVRGTAVTESAVAATPRFEARATVALDAGGRVWVAWEDGPVGWGKDQGYIVRNRAFGSLLGWERWIRVACRTGAGAWQEPAAAMPADFLLPYTYHPHIYADSRGGVWLIAKLRRTAEGAPRPVPIAKDGYQPLGHRGFYEYWATRFDGRTWSAPLALPESRGRLGTRPHAALDRSGNLWVAWPGDNRAPKNPHRPVRGQVYAGRIAAPAQAAEFTLKAAAAPRVEPRPGHAAEAADIRALRAYRANIGGRQYRLLRGDLHRHTDLSWDIGGTTDGSLQDFYRYMIDAAAMDFGSSTDHQGGAWPYWWWFTQKLTDMYHAPGAYVPIFGYERSAQFPFGHRNIFFLKRSDARVTPFFIKEGTPGMTLPAGPQGDEPPVGSPSLVANDTVLLWEDMRRYRAVAISHTSGNNMGTDWRFWDPELDPLVEIFQGCRTSYEQEGAPHAAVKPRDAEHMGIVGYRPEGMVSNAWGKGYKLGTVASSDHFSTHISYAMVYALTPDRQGILEAIRKRRTYGATDNILLDVRMGDHFMGEEFKLSGSAPIQVRARGTGPVARVDIIRDSAVIYSTEPKRSEVAFSYTDRAAPPGRHYYYVRLLQQDEMIAWSSPFFVNY
ncbi:MAG: hypothetical protein ACE15B_09925 [Bryobacteraceae bacterium]